MRLRNSKGRLSLLLTVSLAATAALATSLDSSTGTYQSSSLSSTPKERGTKDAPVDGIDGRPHEGPFVEAENLRSTSTNDLKKDLPPLEGRPKDPTVIDGVKIPETNDGVMNDPNRAEPKEGTTGTAGGVSEKDQVRKAKEGATGEKVENKPAAPKVAPPLSHSEQEKISSKEDPEKDRSKTDGKNNDDVSPGLEKPIGLPEKTYDQTMPLPNSANKNHLDVAPGKSSSKISTSNPEDVEGVIRPFHSFVLSLTMILFSEVGDKTFLVAALMAMKHDRLVVFTAAFGALITMTILSAVLGHAVPTLIPKKVTNFLAAALFLVFGARMLKEGLAMSPDEGVSAEMAEVEMELEEKEIAARKAGRRRSSISPYALEMGLNRTHTRKSRSQSRFPTPPRSPSASPERSLSPRRGAFWGLFDGANNLFSLLLSPAWVQTFVMTFLGEWGDRSQIATIAMAAGQDYWWVTLGAVLGHGCCTGVAVLGGRAIAGRVSLRVVTIGGAVAFLVFGVIYLVEAWWAS
ncbi:GCR1-dependent translation factor 1 [Gnomoniopsis smithogilvyi]|uniref:GCR1-dependent translation factor 1 n=1 Tax=Gnomoniopsis smithogilvyi TaxID=1191159 RepID=A0A9W8YM64_9PEZI|nr:GCR1-dependent translation factor 1 [Gnomoniopsis smithogilvyi]